MQTAFEKGIEYPVVYGSGVFNMGSKPHEVSQEIGRLQRRSFLLTEEAVVTNPHKGGPEGVQMNDIARHAVNGLRNRFS